MPDAHPEPYLPVAPSRPTERIAYPPPRERIAYVPPRGRVEFDGVGVAPDGEHHRGLPETTFHLEPGRCLVALGPSGSGAALVDLLMGRRRPSTGTVRISVDLQPGGPPIDRGHRIEYLRGAPWSQSGRPPPTLIYDATLRHQPEADALSDHQRQGLELLHTQWADVAVLILDEPTAGLDRRERNELVAVLSQLSCTTIIVTADPVVAALGDQLVELAPLSPLRPRPVGPRTLRFRSGGVLRA